MSKCNLDTEEGIKESVNILVGFTDNQKSLITDLAVGCFRKGRNSKMRYDEEVDILNVFVNDKKCEHSIDIEAQVVVDFDEKDKIIAFEIMDFEHQIENSQKKYAKMFKEVKEDGRKTADKSN